MSVIHYKFKSSKDYDSVTFDGLALPLGDLKLQIVQQKKLGKVTDFDLVVTNAQTNEDYREDHTMVPKNASVIVRRVPASKNGGLSQYLQMRSLSAASTPTSHPIARPTITSGASEDDRIKAMLSQTVQEWDPSAARPRHYSNTPQQYRIPPPTYVCYRCNQKGHYISACPTNDNPAFDLPKVRRTTGIPKSFLKPVEGTDIRPGMMVHTDGSLVMVEPNHHMWEKVSVAHAALTIDNVPPELKCPICHEVLKEAVQVACCGANYCDECIRRNLVDDTQFHCVVCKRGTTLDRTTLNQELRRSIEQFVLDSVKAMKDAKKGPGAGAVEMNIPPAPKEDQIVAVGGLAEKVSADATMESKNFSADSPSPKTAPEMGKNNGTSTSAIPVVSSEISSNLPPTNMGARGPVRPPRPPVWGPPPPQFFDPYGYYDPYAQYGPPPFYGYPPRPPPEYFRPHPGMPYPPMRGPRHQHRGPHPGPRPAHFPNDITANQRQNGQEGAIEIELAGRGETIDDPSTERSRSRSRSRSPSERGRKRSRSRSRSPDSNTTRLRTS